MSDSIIEVKGLSKKYILSHESQEKYKAMRDVIANKVRSLVNRQQNLKALTQEEFWALKDVEFNIKQGDRVGIIGRNGAGKSTLLKILSRITEPTSGSIKIKGRVASLLEVGTGFHPELTGRENIFLNGAILGMSRTEIRKKFDEIVDFAEVERFLDTPVKRYSSGMYVRLAFAIAAHLEPEILIVDEVLAVGDSNFQKKCLGKMEDVSKGEGRTILFVSHNLNALKILCNAGVLLEQGQLGLLGDINGVINCYLDNYSVVKTNELIYKDEHCSTSIQINTDNLVSFGESLEIVVEINSLRESHDEIFAIGIDHAEGVRIMSLDSNKFEVFKGYNKLIFKFNYLTLNPGVYNILVLGRDENNTINFWKITSRIEVVSNIQTPFAIANCQAINGGFRGNLLIESYGK